MNMTTIASNNKTRYCFSVREMFFDAFLHKPGIAFNFFLLMVILFFDPSDIRAQTFPAGFSRVRVVFGITNPSAMAFAPDGRIFIAEQGGSLRVVKNDQLLTTPFVTLSVNAN